MKLTTLTILAALAATPALADPPNSAQANLNTAPDGTATTSGMAGNGAMNGHASSQAPVHSPMAMNTRKAHASLKTAPDGTATTSGPSTNSDVNIHADSQAPVAK